MLHTFEQPQYPSPSIPSHHPFQVPHHTDPLLQSSHQSSKLPRQRQKQRILQVKRVVGLRHLPLEIISTANSFRHALNIRGAVTSWNPNNFSYKFLTVQFETGKPKNFEKLEFNPISSTISFNNLHTHGSPLIVPSLIFCSSPNKSILGIPRAMLEPFQSLSSPPCTQRRRLSDWSQPASGAVGKAPLLHANLLILVGIMLLIFFMTCDQPDLIGRLDSNKYVFKNRFNDYYRLICLNFQRLSTF